MIKGKVKRNTDYTEQITSLKLKEEAKMLTLNEYLFKHPQKQSAAKLFSKSLPVLLDKKVKSTQSQYFNELYIYFRDKYDKYAWCGYLSAACNGLNPSFGALEMIKCHGQDVILLKTFENSLTELPYLLSFQ